MSSVALWVRLDAGVHDVFKRYGELLENWLKGFTDLAGEGKATQMGESKAVQRKFCLNWYRLRPLNKASLLY